MYRLRLHAASGPACLGLASALHPYSPALRVQALEDMPWGGCLGGTPARFSAVAREPSGQVPRHSLCAAPASVSGRPPRPGHGGAGDAPHGVAQEGPGGTVGAHAGLAPAPVRCRGTAVVPMPPQRPEPGCSPAAGGKSKRWCGVSWLGSSRKVVEALSICSAHEPYVGAVQSTVKSGMQELPWVSCCSLLATAGDQGVCLTVCCYWLHSLSCRQHVACHRIGAAVAGSVVRMGRRAYLATMRNGPKLLGRACDLCAGALRGSHQHALTQDPVCAPRLLHRRRPSQHRCHRISSLCWASGALPRFSGRSSAVRAMTICSSSR